MFHPSALFHTCLELTVPLISASPNLPLAPESPYTPVSTANILGVKVIQVPSQGPKPVLPRLHQDIDLVFTLLHDPPLVTLHVPLGISRADDGYLGLE